MGDWVMSGHIKVSRGMGLPLVALRSVGRIPAKYGGEQEAARVFYVAVTQVTPRLGLVGRGI